MINPTLISLETCTVYHCTPNPSGPYSLYRFLLPLFSCCLWRKHCIFTVCSESSPSFCYPCDLLMLTNSAPAKSSHAPAREMFKETPSLENMRLWVSWWVLLCVPSLQLQAGAAVFLLHCRVLRCRLFTTLDRFPWQPGCLHMKSNQLPQMRAFVSIVTITRREREKERKNICPNKWPNLPKLITESPRKQIRSQP